VGGQLVTIRGTHAAYEGFVLPLFGEHAARNAAAAAVAMETFLGHPLDEEALREAFAAVRSPGRLEVVSRHPLVLLDGAHNPAGARALATTLDESFAWERLLLVVGVSANKDVAGVIRPLAPLATVAYVAPHSSPRSAPADTVAAALEDAGVQAATFPSVPEALATALADANEDDLLLVTGSLYTVADARRVLAPPDEPI
jgi:dihydrofolate synthase/folylpolyglutamate synthase